MPVYLNVPVVEQQVARAGMSMREFCQIHAGISEVTISCAKGGRPVRPSTLRAVALGLSRLRELPGFAGLDVVTATPPARNGRAANVGLAPVAAREESREPAPSKR
jgi:hypothetical protein